jgi:DNA-binding response OmpR family regulator
MAAARILSVGKDKFLMASRKMLLRAAGYDVEEADSMDRAIALATSDAVDAAILCHSVFKSEQQLFLVKVREERRLMPILYIRAYAYQSAPDSCIAVGNEPEILLNILRLAIEPPPLD